MSAHDWGQILRTQKDNFCTPNIYDVNIKDGTASISLEYFREVRKETEYFLFIEWEGQIFYPLWLEFRSINNHLLFLTEELNINSFALLRRILQSSMAKEEKWVNEMKAIVFHPQTKPLFCHCLKNFAIEEDFATHIFEKNL